ncbi:MAG: Co2+/Mg2+ efflux protein ApaG [Beijerinckiaceae bacterium]
MYRKTTHNISISAEPRFLPDESRPDQARFFWAYTIEIENCGSEPVQLLARHWKITDGNGRTQEVHGIGVVGEQPIIAPGARYSYTSGCPLSTPHGIMTGIYNMLSENGDPFNVDIPAFPLHSPHVKQALN